MPEAWYPGATRNPGANAGYKAGRTSMVDTVAHYTVGVDSTGIGLQGYFHWLIARDGAIQQFAEADALTWHVGEDNAYGPGIEIEYLPGQDAEVFTDAARTACSGLIHWLNTEWGIPLIYHDGDHDITPGGFAGFVSHKSIIQSIEHQDFWPQSDWNLMTVVPPTPAPIIPPSGDEIMITATTDKDGNVYIFGVAVDQQMYFRKFTASTQAWDANWNTLHGTFPLPYK